jgi:acyl-coenzyme A thioesterase PaaI-like protein
VNALWTPTDAWEGFQNIIHGGIISTVLDEAMSKAVVLAGCEAPTGELRVRFRQHVAPGETLQVRAWVAGRRKRLIETEATLTGAGQVEYAHAWASFLALGHRGEKRKYENCSSDE